MKKIYKLLLVLAAGLSVGTSAYAQFPESFEGGVVTPTGWVSFDNGVGLTQSWKTNTVSPQSGTVAAYVRYEAGGNAQDWLVSPLTSISAAANSLSFYERESYNTDFGSVYNVLVSTTSQTAVVSFSTISTYPETTTNPTAYRQRIIDLSAYNGQSVYIAFRMDNNDGDDWFLDNIELTAVPTCTTPPVAGTISGPSSTLPGSSNSYTVSPATGNIQWYVGSSSTGPWSAIGSATSAISSITATGSGTVYYNVIASTFGCPNDTAVAYPVTINNPGDNVCDAVTLTFGTSPYYKLNSASIQTGEVAPPGTGCSTNNSWCNSTLHNTRWFKFTAPSSGYVTVQSPGFDTQLAVWKASACSNLLSLSTATLIAANDDDTSYTTHSGAMFSSFLKAACLTPGTVYYIQLDSYSAATASDSTQIIISDLGAPLNASFTGLAANYCTTDPATTLIPVTTGGVFTINTNTSSVTQFNPSQGAGTYTVNYSIYGCLTQSTTVVSVCTGIKQFTNDEVVSVYPNPNNGSVRIFINANFTANTLLEVYDALGKLVIKESLTKEETTINTSKLEDGIYFYKIINNNKEVKIGRMIKQ